MPDNQDRYTTLTSSDKEAERLLALAILFENAEGPLTTATIRKSIYGYCKSDETARKAFMRDREKLVLCGLVIRQVTTPNGAHLWLLDDAETFVDGDELTPEEATTLTVACTPLMNDAAFPYSNELRIALSKIDRSFSKSPNVPTNPHTREVRSIRTSLERCAAEGVAARISYSRADGSTTNRSIGVCGFFSVNGNTYVVAKRIDLDQDNEPHSYNLARVSSVKPIKGCRFAVPKDFDIRCYTKLPFQVGETLYAATFSVPENEVANLKARSLGKGNWHGNAKNKNLWDVDVSNTEVAASWAIANAVIPLSPNSLKTYWTTLLKECLNCNAL